MLSHRVRRRGRLAATAAALLAVAVAVSPATPATARAAPSEAPPAAEALPRVRHVFVINLENKGYDETFGPGSPATYLSRTLRRQGQLLTQYYGTAHNSLGNYLAQISGQGPNPQVQADCQVFTDFVQVGTVAPGQAVGQGCVFPASVPTLADQLDAAGLRWKGYLHHMGTPCRHPAIGAQDDTQQAEVGDQYATRHNPFVYFHSIIDSPRCAERAVDLSALRTDLRLGRTTPNLTYVTPDLCADGHDEPLPGITGPGGGRVGAVVVSPFVTPRTWNDTPYNHYSLLRTIEDLFGLDRLGYAAADTIDAFGTDVFGRTP